MHMRRVSSEEVNKMWWQEIFGLGVENGSLHLFGMQDASEEWIFKTVTHDRLEELFNEVSDHSTIIESWPIALEILDRNYWIYLTPLEPILSEFKSLIWDAVRERTEDHDILEIWQMACSIND